MPSIQGAFPHKAILEKRLLLKVSRLCEKTEHGRSGARHGRIECPFRIKLLFDLPDQRMTGKDTRLEIVDHRLFPLINRQLNNLFQGASRRTRCHLGIGFRRGDSHLRLHQTEVVAL